jgi:hypothetical protein
MDNFHQVYIFYPKTVAPKREGPLILCTNREVLIGRYEGAQFLKGDYVIEVEWWGYLPTNPRLLRR